MVRLAGVATGGASGAIMFTLPSSYRPLQPHAFTTYCSGGLAILTILANGDVQPNNSSVAGSAVNTFIVLDGTAFRAEQ